MRPGAVRRPAPQVSLAVPPSPLANRSAMNRPLPLSILLLSATAALAACSKSEAPAAEAAAAPAASAPAASAAPAAAPASLTSEAPPENARVWLVDLADGAEVSSPLLVKFGAEGIAVAPAGSHEPATGHHHLVIDAELPAYDQPIPASANYVHFGKGQTETTVELTPGPHTLQLVFANGSHVPFNPPLVSEKITVTVK